MLLIGDADRLGEVRLAQPGQGARRADLRGAAVVEIIAVAEAVHRAATTETSQNHRPG